VAGGCASERSLVYLGIRKTCAHCSAAVWAAVGVRAGRGVVKLEGEATMLFPLCRRLLGLAA
jgi:hypothetical protein